MRTNVLFTDPRPPFAQGSGGTWGNVLSSVFVELEFELLGPATSPPRGRIYRQPFGDLTFLRSIAHGSAHRATRSERLICTSKHNNFFIGYLLSGSALLSQDGRTAELRPGDIAILDSTHVYSIEVPRAIEVVWIHTPRYRLEGRLRNPSEILATRIDGASGVGHVASEMLRAAIAEAARLSAAEANRVANNLLDLLGVALARRYRADDVPPRTHIATMLRRVQDNIEVHLDDETLTRDRIARENRISVRYLNKLFAREGYSVSRWIRLRRLERCRLDLEAPEASARPIGEIAYSHGFKNVSHFNRLFRAHFGCSPRALREHKREPC